MSALISIIGQDQNGTNLNPAYVSTTTGVETFSIWGSNDSTFELDNNSVRFKDIDSSSPGRYLVTTTATQPSSGTTSLNFLVPDNNYVHAWTSSGLTYKGYFKITYLSSGPTVISITSGYIVTNDTVSNTDFTLLKNASAYANTNISLTAATITLPSDAQVAGYTYNLQYDGTAVYSRSVDSKSFTDFYYDSSWTSSASSGRSTNSNRILNVLASIPTTTTFGSGTDVNGNPNALTTVHFPSGRRIRHTTAIYENNVHTRNFYLDFAVQQKIVNGVSEIVGTFYEIKEDTDGSNVSVNQSSDHIIGDNATMTYTRTLFGDSIDYVITDWVYSAEPEGDGYVAPVTTTSNGGGKPDRYPLIMTNLFNRNRSIYSIGMTHKDTWDLFL